MACWNLAMYFYHRTHNFSVNPNMNYNDLQEMISNHYNIILGSYLLEIYDLRFRRYVILDEEYIISLQDRLPRTSVSTLNGRILTRRNTSRNYLSTDLKRKQTSSFSPQNDHLIIWLDSYIGHPENCRQLKHLFYITTMFDIARSMLDYEVCIDDLIQTNSQSINHLNTFSNKDECLNFLKHVESKIKIIFITSNLLGEEIVPLIVQRVHMIYILVNDTVFSYEWAFDYKSSLLIFHEATCLLVRLTRDLAQDFFEKAELTLTSSVKQTITLLKWARKLYNRANEIDTPSYLPTLKLINCRLERLELNEEKDDKFALECDEG
jgi:hypothetical protein